MVQVEIQDAVAADPRHYTVELETEQIRVVRYRYGPGEQSVMHTHPALVVIPLTDSSVRFHLPDGSAEEVTLQAGQVLEMPASAHLPENLRDTTIEGILVELKG